jgi:hypothetical protein
MATFWGSFFGTLSALLIVVFLWMAIDKWFDEDWGKRLAERWLRDGERRE